MQALYSYMLPQPSKLPIDLSKQSIILNEEEGIRCSTLCVDGKLSDFTKEKGIYTLYDCIKAGIRASENGPHLGTRKDANSPYEWLTYKETEEMTHNFGSALVTKVKLSAKSMIGICASNNTEEKKELTITQGCSRYAWVISDFACQTYSLITVPLYETLGRESLIYILSQTELEVIIIDTETRIKMILDVLSEAPSVRCIIATRPVSDEVRTLAQGRVEILLWADCITEGKQNPVSPCPPKPDDLFTICYTSGTTGNPKGVQLSHSNIVHELLGLTIFENKDYQLTKNDVHLSYLPLSHIFERISVYQITRHGAQYGFFRGDIRGVIGDVAELRPTVFGAVPRILNRIMDKVMATITTAGWIKSTLFHWGLDSKMAEMKK